MKTTRRPFTELTPDPRNARTHSKKNLAAIKASLEAYGQVEPLVVQKSTGIVIGGNGRMEAMLDLGWTEAEIVEVDLGDTEAKALGIALNRTGDLAGWDQAILDQLVSEIAESASEDSVDTLVESMGLSTKDLEKILVREHERSGISVDSLEDHSDHSLDDSLTYSVIVDFDSEQDQAALLARLEKEGFRCRLLVA